jgi:hypothetical protein
VYACANTIVDFYELVMPASNGEGSSDFPTGKDGIVNLTPASLQRIRENTGGTPKHTPVAAAHESALAVKAEASVKAETLGKRPREHDDDPSVGTQPKAEVPPTSAPLA